MENLTVFFDLENENESKIPDGLKKTLHNRNHAIKICNVKPCENDKTISQASLMLINKI